MRDRQRMTIVFASCALATGVAYAHATPPLRLASERDAATRLIGPAQRYFVREVRPSKAERAEIKQRSGWAPDRDRYRFYVGRSADGGTIASAVFLTDFTLHGPVRVGVALSPGGKAKGAAVVEVSEEAYSWVKPLLDAGFLDQVTRADRARAVDGVGNSMQRFYARVIAGLITRAEILYALAVRDKQPG